MHWQARLANMAEEVLDAYCGKDGQIEPARALKRLIDARSDEKGPSSLRPSRHAGLSSES